MSFPLPGGAARRRSLVSLFCLAVAVASLGVPATGLRAADAPSFVILVDGLCSELPVGAQVTSTFSAPGGLVERLRIAGWPDTAIAGYSYRGGAPDAFGLWQPLPYACTDSRDQGLAADVDLLESQVIAIAATHPGAVFHLVGFSQGGLVAFGYLARIAARADWALPAGASLGSVTTLDAPLGGAPFVDLLCGYAPDICGGSPIPGTNSALHDMSAIWDTGTGHPAGAMRSVAARVADSRLTNQAVALAAAGHGVTVLTIGNVRDWLYAPIGPDAGTLAFLDTQWLTTDPRGAGVHARAIDSGPSGCPAAAGDLAASYGCNHVLVTRDAAVGAAVLAVISHEAPMLTKTCAAGRGNCLALPPRPATLVKSVIAPGIVSGGGKFGTAAASVKSGGRATILFTTSPALPGATLEIWGRSATGAYMFMTTRRADSHGVVRYYTPPITGWAAIHARYPGDFVHGTGVSLARVMVVHR